MTTKKSMILIAVGMLLLEASWAKAQSETILFKLESAAGVYNGPSQKTIFTLGQSALITKIWTYHWNNGRGANPGRIGLRNSATGQMVGMWNVTGTYHMFNATAGVAWPARGDGPPFLYWTVQPNVNVAAGTYEVVDSDPSTWAYNSDMQNMGCAWVYGSYGGGNYGQVVPSPVATPQVQPTPPPSTTSGVYTLTAVTPDSHNAAPGKYQPNLARDGPGFGYEVLSCSSGRAEMRWWSTDGQGPGEFQVRWEWNVPSQLLPGQVWPIAGTVTVVKNHNIWPAKHEELSTGSYFWPGDPASIGPQVTSDNPAGSRVTQKAVGTVSTAKADFDMNMSNAEGCMFWYHYKWNPGGAYTQVVPSPVATPEVNPQPAYGGMGSVNIAGNWTLSDGSFGSLAVSQAGATVNMTYPKRSGRVIGHLQGNVFDGYWVQDFSGRHCSQPQYNSSFWGRMILTFTGDSYAGNWGYCDEAPGIGFHGNRAASSYGQIVPSPPATPEVQPATPGTQSEVVLFKLESVAGVSNNPPQRTIFRLDQPAFITKIFTYHWNDGRGATPGNIGLKNAATGQVVGRWRVTGTYHMFSVAPGAAWPSQGDGPPFLYWNVQPNVNVPAGTYEVLDSDPGTWAYNSEMRNMGCAWVFGNYGGGSYGQVVPSPPAAPQGAMSIRIVPSQQTINSGDKVNTSADVAGGTPPYTFAWYNGTKQSQVIKGRVTWTMRGAGTRNIRVVVTDSAGGTAEAHAQIEVREGGGGSTFVQTLTSGSILSGEAWEIQGPRNGRRWPFQLRITSYDPGTGAIVGELTWPTLSSVHRIRGLLEGPSLTFTEIEAIQPGSAHLNVSYDLTVGENSADGTYADHTDNTNGGVRLTTP